MIEPGRDRTSNEVPSVSPLKPCVIASEAKQSPARVGDCFASLATAVAAVPRMTAALDLREDHAAILLGVLRAHLPNSARAVVFGSRAHGGARRYSVLDLALEWDQTLGLDIVGQIAEALSEPRFALQSGYRRSRNHQAEIQGPHCGRLHPPDIAARLIPRPRQ